MRTFKEEHPLGAHQKHVVCLLPQRTLYMTLSRNIRDRPASLYPITTNRFPSNNIFALPFRRRYTLVLSELNFEPSRHAKTLSVSFQVSEAACLQGIRSKLNQLYVIVYREATGGGRAD
jgi:hypothetical protein